MNGSLQDNELSDGCRVTLLPIVETGLTVCRWTLFGYSVSISFPVVILARVYVFRRPKDQN